MRNIFLLYMPPGNLEAMTHYRDTIQRRVPFEQFRPFVSGDVASRIKHVFGDRPIAVWGSRDSPANRAKFEKMEVGDDILIVEGDTIKFMGKMALKTVNPDLSRTLWKNIDPDETSGWDLIYFIANPVEVGVPFAEFRRLFSYANNYQLRGFTPVANDRLEEFYRRYDDLYAILMRVKAGQDVIEKPPIAAGAPEEVAIAAPIVDVIDEALAAPAISDHVRMQWKIANLGLKAGEKIWVPTSDQGRLRSAYNFSEFEAEFSTGIDLQKRYYENIDVVWKEEYRIGAAFEVENSTAIYSGLLRFADLNVVAPNTLYPMFIVAPVERRNQVRGQVLRPAFKRLLPGKVRFLTYESVDDIERFFADSATGVTVELIQSKAEAIE